MKSRRRREREREREREKKKEMGERGSAFEGTLRGEIDLLTPINGEEEEEEEEEPL